VNADLLLYLGFGVICLTIGIDLGARVMAEATSNTPDPLAYSYQTLRLKHADAGGKAQAAAEAARALQKAQDTLAQAEADLAAHLEEHIRQLRQTFSVVPSTNRKETP
jgi:hypothetical protein